MVQTMLYHVAAETMKLTDGWQVQSSAKIQVSGAVLSSPSATTDGWYVASVPSTVMGVLIANGAEKEPLTAADYQQIDSRQFDVSWWYRTTFSLPQPPSDLPRRGRGGSVILTFDGICYRANVWLNGQLIAAKDTLAGSFRQFSIDITPYARETNVLAVELFRAQPGDPNIGFADWNPRPADENMGIFREVSIKTCGKVSVAHSSVRSRVETSTLKKAWLTIDSELTNLTDETVKGTLRGRVDGETFTCPVTLLPNERRMVRLASDVCKENPRLWWCHNMGKPELYDLHVEFVEGTEVSDAEDVRFGIREVHSHLTPEGHRAFTLNGRDILLRGAGWTDDIYLRNTPASNRLQLEYVRDMNLNLVRLEGFWGNSQNLYDICDELGLLILVGWSCHWEWEEYLGAPCDETYGGIVTPEKIDLISKSFEDQVLWLRHHPSIIGWFVGSDRIPTPELEQRYQTFLRANDDRTCLISAKGMTSTVSGPSGTKMEGPYEYVSPMYWYSPQASGGAFGFNTETGIGAQLPVRESLERMLGPDLLPIDSRWDILCTASTSAMNSLAQLTEVIDNRFGVSADITSYLHRADLLNYESTRAMFEAFRVNVPRTTGIVQWMLNSARPGIYWQLYDYYYQPNAAYYAVKRGNAPVQLIYDYQRKAVFAVNETLQPVTLKASMHIVHGGSTTVISDSTTTYVEAGAVVKVFDCIRETTDNGQQTTDRSALPLATEGTQERQQTTDCPQTDAFLFLKAVTADGKELAENEYFLPGETDEYAWDKRSWIHTPISRYASYQALDRLPQAACRMTSLRVNGIDHPRYQLTLENTSPHVAFFIRLSVKDDNGNLVCPAYWSDNYVTLAPYDKREIICDMPSLPIGTSLHFAIDGWNINH